MQYVGAGLVPAQDFIGTGLVPAQGGHKGRPYTAKTSPCR
jgi:hypothetical protein